MAADNSRRCRRRSTVRSRLQQPRNIAAKVVVPPRHLTNVPTAAIRVRTVLRFYHWSVLFDCDDGPNIPDACFDTMRRYADERAHNSMIDLLRFYFRNMVLDGTISPPIAAISLY